MTFHVMRKIDGKLVDISIPHTDRKSAETTLKYFTKYFGKKASEFKIEEKE